MVIRLLLVFYLALTGDLYAQSPTIDYIPASIDFSEKISEWDGFGFNYVEAAQHRDYFSNPQDYGGFSLLNSKQQEEIIDLVFAEDGLAVQIIKMFLDPFHQVVLGEPFDHQATTKNMMNFVMNGLKATHQRDDELEIITTLYGPPAWATRQKFIGARDLDHSQVDQLCTYMIDWVKYLQAKKVPVKYLSLHNEGEDFYRWNHEEGTQRLEKFDYNMYWPPQQVNHFLKVLPRHLEANGLADIKVTNGEPSNWTRFHFWNYSHSLYQDDEALENLGLLTTHGFVNGDIRRLSYGLPVGTTTRLLREKKPNLHAWITSYSWGNMGTDFVRTAHEQIYTARVNALIPWAGIQCPSRWVGGDPNPGTAIQVNDDGSYEVLKGYYFYKQLTQAGRRGMSVARATLSNPLAFIIAFASNGTSYPDAFVVTSDISIWSLPIKIDLKGTQSTTFRGFRSSENGEEQYQDIGLFVVEDGSIVYDPPKGTSTTFIAVE